jgi:hypothetical protein
MHVIITEVEQVGCGRQRDPITKKEGSKLLHDSGHRVFDEEEAYNVCGPHVDWAEVLLDAFQQTHGGTEL